MNPGTKARFLRRMTDHRRSHDDWCSDMHYLFDEGKWDAFTILADMFIQEHHADFEQGIHWPRQKRFQYNVYEATVAQNAGLGTRQLNKLDKLCRTHTPDEIAEYVRKNW